MTGLYLNYKSHNKIGNILFAVERFYIKKNTFNFVMTSATAIYTN